uniref:Uncharacterized protein n=1 Tax=Rhizophora mucronata TaxID=61149 RepID=A0A2P2PCJ1_RHIMU
MLLTLMWFQWPSALANDSSLFLAHCMNKVSSINMSF